MPDNNYALGLTVHSSNDEIRDAVFASTLKVGRMSIATVALDGVTPTSRIIEVQSLDDNGNLYIGMSCGKPIYAEIKKNPRIVGSLINMTKGNLGYSIRINATVTEVEDEEIYTRYWAQNSGTKALYRRSLENFKIFRLTGGDGELFDLCVDDHVLRYRFGFGGESARPWVYSVNDSCTGCGVCSTSCLTDVIKSDGGRAIMNHNGCLECGVCKEVCPFGAIDCNM